MNIRSRVLYLIIFTVLVLGIRHNCLATNYFVEITGDYFSNGLSQASAWPTVPYAIQKSANGDVINVGTGDFRSTEWTKVTKQLTIIGSDTYNASAYPSLRHTTRTILGYSQPPTNSASIMEIYTNNVAISNITFNGGYMSNVTYAIHTEINGITVKYCTVQNFKNGYGLYCSPTNPLFSPTPDHLRNTFQFNLIKNVIQTNATGIFLERSPSTVANNDFVTITGAQSLAAIYIRDCALTNGSTDWVSIDSNYFFECTQAIWANYFGNTNEKIYIRDNNIRSSLVGIRVTEANGQSIITGNSVGVGGYSTSTNSTPARGIWVQADSDPWNLKPTDHQIIGNFINDTSLSTGTVGVLLEYDTKDGTKNNGVNATVISNSVSGFYLGMYVQSGTNGIKITNSPLVDVTIQYNDINASRSWALFADGMTNPVIAPDNWFGDYVNATNVITGNVSFSNWVTGGAQLTDTDGDGTNDYLDLDDDNDGLNDTNELPIGTLPYVADTDADGQTDWEEYKVSGTDPTNKYSVFQIIQTPTNPVTTFVLSWPSYSNRLYNVYRSTNLLEGFGALLSNDIAATYPTNTFVDAPGSSLERYFYLVTVTNTVP